MQQTERLAYLIEYLWQETHDGAIADLPDTETERFETFRGLVNVRPATPIEADFIEVQDVFLKNYNAQQVTSLTSLTPYLKLAIPIAAVASKPFKAAAISHSFNLQGNTRLSELL